jgi:hypothetical protein
MPKVTWTPEMYAKLKRLYSRHTNAELVEITGWSLNELSYRSGVLGLKKTRKTIYKCCGSLKNIAKHKAFIRRNFDKMTNREIAKALGLTLSMTRKLCHEMKLYRQLMEYWTDEQVQYLKDNYRHIGDTELAAIFNSKWKKDKGWTLKHIEKKRLYLKLKRTTEELNAIRDRNVEACIWSRGKGKTRWTSYGISKEGEIRFAVLPSGRLVPMIKVGSDWLAWARRTWEQVHGPTKPGEFIVFKNDDPMEYVNGINALEMISREEHLNRNRKKTLTDLSDGYIAGMLSYGRPELKAVMRDHAELIDLKRQELLLTREIKKHERAGK